MLASRVATMFSSTIRPSSPVSEKSSIAVSSVTLAAGFSPHAAATASALPSSVPPMQKPSVFTLSLRAMPRATASACNTPFST
ncbi:hypothetical protein D3C85_885300 [compost metagenome]